jgi:hypothetical protein
MLFYPKYEEQLGVLEERLSRAHALTPDLMSDVIANACTRFAPSDATRNAQVNKLIGTCTWSAATHEMFGVELAILNPA